MVAPASTYRLQIRPSWDLNAAAELCGYLAALGADAVYLSPLLPSVPGSEHGYDVIGWDGIDPQRGGEDGWRAFLAAARGHGLKVVLDIVPNHAAAVPESPVWASVLADGADSPYASWFDIEWRGPSDTGGATADLDGHWLHYRRFFAVDTLAGLRQEDEAVFDATHAAILRWVREDGPYRIDGLRIDHPDGLLDPGGYLERLRTRAGQDCWIVVEKILEGGEDLLESWPVAGTTGYDALTELTNLFVDPDAVIALSDVYRLLVSHEQGYAECVAAAKREVAESMLRPEVERLARLAPTVERADEALTALLVAFPAYRTYLPEDATYLAIAITKALEAAPDLADEITELASRLDDPADELCLRFQQTTGAVMAKGVEDTAFYRYTRFVGANEVGGDPGALGASLDTFHGGQVFRQQTHPESMTTLSTHDTKRSEDVRARLAVLAEIPEEWSALVGRLLKDAPVPDAPFAYLLWQTFAGAGFIERERMHAYIEKAMREAATSTNWISPDAAFESLVHAVVDRAYDDPVLHEPLREFIERITPYGWTNSLSQKLVQLTMPGVPDVYQGNESWDYSLVDPDNRRPVDFAALTSRLAALDAATSPPAIDASGDAKLWVTSRALRLRGERPQLFTDYDPLEATGPAARHVVAFDRGGAITVATRLPVALEAHGGWDGTVLDVPGTYTDVLTGQQYAGQVPLADLLRAYPVALLAR